MTLSPRWILNGIDLTAPPFLVEMNGSDHGAPESVRSAIASMLADGDVDLIDRHSNRNFEIPVLIEGDLAEVAAAEATLVSAVMLERGTLVFEPGDDVAPASVFETFAGDVVLTQNETEDDAGLRRVRVSFPARPFARPEDPITIDAPPVIGSTTTTVDSGSSTSGWSMLSTAPAPTTNLEPDPSVTSMGGWVAGAGANSAVYNSGYGAIIVTRNGGSATTYVNSAAYQVTPGRFYRFGWSLLASGFQSPKTLVRWYSDTAATQVISESSYNGSSSATDQQTPVLTAPAGAVRARYFPSVLIGAGSFGVARRWVNESTEVASLASGFFSGATPDTSVQTFSWTGAANASTSTLTWTAPKLWVVSDMVTGTVYGRSSAAIRRAGSVSMSSLPYMRIKGTATAITGGSVTVADAGVIVAPASYSYNPTTGAFEILVNRSSGFSSVDLTFTMPGGLASSNAGLFVAVDSIEITDNPFATGKTQTRQVQIYGSQRTELSLSVLGLDAAGTIPVGLGEQTLVYTASAGDDGRAKFLACRTSSTVSAPGTSDSSAVSAFFNPLSVIGSPLGFTFPASTLLTGTYMVIARVRSATAGSSDISLRAFVDPTVGDLAYDPRTGWKTAPLTVANSGAAWPCTNTNTWVMVPLGLLRLPPADVEDDGATVTVQVARGANPVDLDDLFLLNADVGQASLLLTGLSSGSYSEVRLDAATVDAAQASAWVGVAGGPMIADAARWIGEQHAAAPGLLQIATVTPGCATSRVSAHYYPRFHTHVASIESA